MPEARGWANKIAGASLIATIVIGGFAAREAQQSAAEASKSAAAAERANELTADAAEVAVQEAKLLVARRIYIGEAPVNYEPEGVTRWAAINASPVDVTQAWVEVAGPKGRISYDIGSLARCTVYILNRRQDEFDPTSMKVFFFDGTHYWERLFDGRIEESERSFRPLGDDIRLPFNTVPIPGTCGS